MKTAQEIDNYIPYGEEWEKEMMKLPKKFLIDMIRKRGAAEAEKALVLKEALEKIRSMLYANKESNLNTEIDIINTALTQYNKP